MRRLWAFTAAVAVAVAAVMVAAPTSSAPPLAFTEDFAGPLSPSQFTPAYWRDEEVGQLDPTLNGSRVLIESGALRIDNGEQNYGDTAVRINQPFDFAGRTGAFAADVTMAAKDGWTRLTLSQDPYPVTSYGDDNAAGQGPDRGIDLQFHTFAGCVNVTLRTYADRVESDLFGPQYTQPCVVASATLANHLSVAISNTSIVVAADGTPLGSWAGLNLGFSRGYWYLDSHNHATIKYASTPTWTNRWDNVSFDGPVLAPLNVATVVAIEGRTLGGVPANPTAPRLLFNAQHGQQDHNVTLSYQLNGGPSHPVPLIRLPGLIGVYIISVPVAPAEIVAGSNTVAFTWTGTTGLAPRVADVQIVWGGDAPPTTTTIAATTTTSTTIAATTTTTTTVPPSGLLYSNDFAAPSDLDRLAFDIHYGTIHPSYVPLTFNGDHDMACGAPTTARVVHEHNRPENVWYCAPAGGNAHFMTGMNTGSYNIISFAPLNAGSVIWPATATKVCWDQNLTDLGGRKWNTVTVVSDDTYAANGGDLSYVTTGFEANSGDGTGGVADPVAKIVSGDSFQFVGVHNSVQYTSALGHQSDFSNNYIGSGDKATRFTTCLRDNGNGTVARTQARPTGLGTVTLPGAFPAGPRVFIFGDDTYNADKAGDAVLPDPYTVHWDNITISTG